LRANARQELRFFPFAEPALEARSGPKGSRMTLARLVILTPSAVTLSKAKNLRTGSVKDLWQTDPLPPPACVRQRRWIVREPSRAGENLFQSRLRSIRKLPRGPRWDHPECSKLHDRHFPVLGILNPMGLSIEKQKPQGIRRLRHLRAFARRLVALSRKPPQHGTGSKDNPLGSAGNCLPLSWSALAPLRLPHNQYRTLLPKIQGLSTL